MPLRLAVALIVASACSTPASAPSAAPVAPVAAEPASKAPPPERIDNPERLADYLPQRISGKPPIARHPDRDAPSGTWLLDDRTVTITLSPIADLAELLTPMEMLGLPAQAVLDGQEVRGLIVQGHRAQLTRQLEPPHRARLDVIAAETYHIRIDVEPSDTLDAPLAIAEQLAIANIIRLALRQHATPAPAPTEPPSKTQESP